MANEPIFRNLSGAWFFNPDRVNGPKHLCFEDLPETRQRTILTHYDIAAVRRTVVMLVESCQEVIRIGHANADPTLQWKEIGLYSLPDGFRDEDLGKMSKPALQDLAVAMAKELVIIGNFFDIWRE